MPSLRASKIKKLDEEELIYQAWYRGRLGYKLRPEQKDCLNLLRTMPKGLAVFNLSRRFGKTTTCLTYANEEANRKRTHIRYATAFLSDLEGFLMPIFEQVLQDCPVRLRPSYHKSTKTWIYPRGSTIKLIGVDKNPNGLRGNNIDILIMDESAFVRNLRTIYTSIVVPATMKRPFKLIFPSTPPESPEHFWASDLVPRAKARNTYVHRTIDDISDLDPIERQRLLDEVGGEFSVTARREFFGEIIADIERAVAVTFNEGLHVQQYEPALCFWQIFGDTGGVRDMTVVLKGTFCHRIKKIVVRSELVFDNKTPTPVIVESIKSAFGHMPLVLDAPGQTLVDLGGLGLTAMLPQKDDFSAGIQLLNKAFYSNEIVIHPDCHFLIKTLRGGLLNRQRSDFERSRELGHLDAIAALIYLIRSIDRREYYPVSGQLDPSKFHVPEFIDPLSAELKKLGSFGGMFA